MSCRIHPFVLSGGSGTRLWPVSRRSYPKQFIDLAGEQSLLVQTCQRLQGIGLEKISVLANEAHRFLVAEQLREAGFDIASIVLEPVGRNTAPAALIAALMTLQRGQEDLFLLLPSDHNIGDLKAFQEALLKGISPAKSGKLVTYGIRPTHPETGYGYIQTDILENEANSDILSVKGFVEKPEKQLAKTYFEQGNYFWNAGIFLFSAKSFVEIFQKLQPTLFEQCSKALEKAYKDLDFCRLDVDSYSQCENISLDYAIMEKADNIACIPMDPDWNDLGSWSAVWETLAKDEDGNVIRGDVLARESSNNYLQSTEGICMSLVGVSNIIAVATRDAVLVADKRKAQDVKHIVDHLKAQNRLEATEHKRIYRPWGWYEELSRGDRFQVKCLMVKPGVQLSLQSHYHRAEHWVVVSGTVVVTVGEKVSLMTENESVYIPIGVKHRLGNEGKLPAMLIEVQSGAYLEENDIKRYEDDFGREKPE